VTTRPMQIIPQMPENMLLQSLPGCVVEFVEVFDGTAVGAEAATLPPLRLIFESISSRAASRPLSNLFSLKFSRRVFSTSLRFSSVKTFSLVLLPTPTRTRWGSLLTRM